MQYHPELKSRPNRPSPPLFAFAAAACGLTEQLTRAGSMWRSYDEGTRKEISWLYSPSSGLKQRPFTEPSPVRSGAATAVTSPTMTGDGRDVGAVKRTASAQSPPQLQEQQEGDGQATGGYKLQKLESLSKYQQH